MTVELTCLLILALWSIALNYFPAGGRVFAGGLAWGLSNRDFMPDVPPWVDRADRAQRNHWENFPTIAVVLLLVYLTGQSNGVTEGCAIAIVICRILHAVFYLIGIPILRSAAFIIAMLSLFIIVWQLL